MYGSDPWKKRSISFLFLGLNVLCDTIVTKEEARLGDKDHSIKIVMKFDINVTKKTKTFKFENEEMANFYTKSGLFNIGRLIATINKWLSDSSPVGKNLKSV